MGLEKFIENPYLKNWKRDQYVLNASTLEYEKAGALWLFNAYRNYANYFEMKISSLDIYPKLDKLRLQTGLENFYKDWKDGDTIVLMFINRGWKIGIERKYENCEFVNGWQDFVKETELESGDTLVFYKLNDLEDNTIKICIFKGGNHIIDNQKDNNLDSNDDVEWNISFLKVISGSSMNEGMLVVPKCFKETYGEMMSHVNQIEIGGEQRFIFYSFIGGYLANIFQILKLFHVSPKETVIFTMDNTTILHGRVYQEDGKEIDYSNRLKGCSISGGTNWIWSIHWNNEIEAAESDDINHGRAIVEDSTANLESNAEMNKAALENIIADETVDMEINDPDMGWNKFAREKEVKINETLVFNMLEGEGGLSFDIGFLDVVRHTCLET
ncbi:hypothetical protein POM88_002476 [Heracleum sosnowskyi]|uniref:TF-B3 domain-containing protein n=1 Tax=Heracleum sosnowskyi TaxID=360622 RepID=A0AAD8NBX8_9APIA|nr:hypothetical protein POM88_002476 [Heracleum sosnowskyi]